MSVLTRVSAALALVAGLVPGPAPSGQVPDRVMEEAVLEAALRQQIEEHLDGPARARGTVLCMGIDTGGAPQTPGREFMARFRSDPAVRRLAECDRRAEGAVEAMTLRPAVIVTAGPVEWRAADEAWVSVSYFADRSRSALRPYRVVREKTGWVSLGPIFLGLPSLP